MPDVWWQVDDDKDAGEMQLELQRVKEELKTTQAERDALSADLSEANQRLDQACDAMWCGMC